jgi:hypothetical protein
MKVEQRCYFRCVGKKVYFSQDLVTWEKGSKFFKGPYDAQVKIDGQSGVLIETQVIPTH